MNKGYITLLSVLVLGAIFTVVAVLLLDLGLFAGLNSVHWQNEFEARSAANACTETALQEIRNSTPFSGSGSLIFASSSCSYTVLNLGGQNREVRSVGLANNSTMRIKVLVDTINPSINIASWQELADF